MLMPGEGGQLKTKATCGLQEKGLLFRGFSSFMSLNMDHVHRRKGRAAPKLPCPAMQRHGKHWEPRGQVKHPVAILLSFTCST